MLIALLFACNVGVECEPATTNFCQCEDGFPGNQACDADGVWTACYCPFTGVDDTDVETEPLQGEPDYLSFCSPCHDVRGTGTGDGPSLVAGVPGMTDEQVFTTIREGRGRMPAFRSFPDERLNDIVAYLRAEFGS